MKSLISTFALIVSLLTTATAFAQDVYMDMFNSANQAAVSMSLVTLNNSAVLAASRNAAAKSGATSRSVSLSYLPTAALKQQTVQDLGRQLQTRNPAAAQAFTAALGPGKADYNQLFQQLTKSSGLPANNAATAFAAYVEMAYIVVNDVQDASRLTPAMDQGLQRQATRLLRQNRGLASPAAVAKFGEATKLQAVVLYLGWQSARKNGQASQFRSGIAQQFRQQGLDLSTLRLTSQGLVKK